MSISNSNEVPQLTPAQRERLARLADVLMPAGSGLPAASEVDVHLQWIDQAIAAAPMFAPALLAALQATDDPQAAIERLRTQQPQVFMGFAFLVSGAYLMHPKVRQCLGYEGLALEAKPPLEGESEYYLEDGLLEPVLARGAIYRDVT
jgi:hypothetical protein